MRDPASDRTLRRATLVLCGNQKGGVGKTTLAVHVGAALAELGLRVLLVDLDVNAGATSHLGVPIDLVGSFEMLTGERAFAAVVRTAADEPSLPNGLDLVPSSRALERLERALARDAGPFPRPWECLRRPLAEVRAAERYDLVLLDTPPNLSTPTRAAYVEADFVLAAVTCDRGSLEGLERVLLDIDEARSQSDLNPRLALLGAVLGDLDPRTIPGQLYPGLYRERLGAAGFGGALFETMIPTAVALSRAWHAGRTLFAHDARHPALGAWRQLARELLARMGRPTPSLRAPVPDAAAREAEPLPLPVTPQQEDARP